MVSIVDVGVFRPNRVDLEQSRDELRLSEVEVRRYKRAFGFESVCFDPGLTEADTLIAAARDIPDFGSYRERIRFILRPRTVRSPSPYPQNPLQDVRRALGLQHATAIALTDQACAGGLLALDLAASLLAAEPAGSLVLILTGEKTFGAVGRVIPGVAVLGEATAAGLVGAQGERDEVLGYAGRIVPIPGSGLTMTADALAAFGEGYSSNLNETIRIALDRAGATAADLDAYLPHNVSRIVGIRTGRSLGVANDRIHTANIADTAHCFSADNFINLHSARRDGTLSRGDLYLMTSVGLGATFSAAVLRH